MAELRVFRDAAEAGRGLPGAWVAIGNFDGLHVGHARVLGELRERAREAGAPALVMTFRPHPAEVVGGRPAPKRLLSDAQREEILAVLGVDGLLLQPFDAALAALHPQPFVESILRDSLGCRGIVVGRDFRFGRDRAGDVAVLSSLARTFGAPVVALPPISAAGVVVSSSRIRHLVATGDDELARQLLGRPYVIEARVVEGDRRGRGLGFPTANLDAGDMVVPGAGVHACVAAVGEGTWPAVANVGTRPTFDGRREQVEVHVLGEPGDLYGRLVRVAFLARIRDERRFADAAELVAQIGADVQAARRLLASPAVESWRGPGF